MQRMPVVREINLSLLLKYDLISLVLIFVVNLFLFAKFTLKYFLKRGESRLKQNSSSFPVIETSVNVFSGYLPNIVFQISWMISFCSKKTFFLSGKCVSRLVSIECVGNLSTHQGTIFEWSDWFLLAHNQSDYW